MAARQVTKQAPAWLSKLRRFVYYKCYFPTIGLMRDDCLNETPDVKEAIKRLSPAVYDARQFRISRALYLSNRKEILPEEEWTKMEEDVRYLTPLVEEVKMERQEKQEWNKK